MLLIYNILVGFAFVFILPFFVWKYKFGILSKASVGIKERFGFYDIEEGRYILIHASSVGELKTVSEFIFVLKKLLPEKKILILTMTPYGYQYALEKKLADKVIFAPIDLPFCIERMFKKVTPEMLILVESEMWPNIIFSAKRKGAKVVSINSRMSDRSFKRYLLVQEFMSEILLKMDIICAREDSDAVKFLKLSYGRANVVKTGNMKYDSQKTPWPARTNKDFGFAASDIIFVAGSTREKEEEVVANVYRRLLSSFPALKLIMAPRYPERCPEVENVLTKEKISFVRKTQLSTVNGQLQTVNCLIIDTIGELMGAYSVASIVFVGGSLFAGAGGHNILEPAQIGKPVIFGSFMSNFREPSHAMLTGNAAFRVQNEEEFYLSAAKLLSDSRLRSDMGKRAQEIVASRIGATTRNAEIVKELLL